MNRLTICALLVCVSSALSAEPPVPDRVREQFAKDTYVVTWAKPATFDPAAELEIGDGSGHGFTLGWLRFRPGKDGVEVLSIKLDEERKPYSSKWQPDRVAVVVKSARMKTDDYVALLGDLAAVDAAEVRAVGDQSFFSTNNFWVYARLTAEKKTFVDLDWAGYYSGEDLVALSKPKAAVALSRAAVKGLEFKEHTLRDDERAWASAKFIRDWKKQKEADDYWWVRERYLMMIGVVGDAAAVPALQDIMQGDPKKRDVYYAINAITRLTKIDVRDTPVEEMDVEKVRQKLLDKLREKK